MMMIFPMLRVFFIFCNVDTIESIELQTQIFIQTKKYYKSNNLFHTLGSDFHWANPRMWTMNMDRLMSYINNRSDFGVTVKYATPNEYI